MDHAPDDLEHDCDDQDPMFQIWILMIRIGILMNSDPDGLDSDCLDHATDDPDPDPDDPDHDSDDPEPDPDYPDPDPDDRDPDPDDPVPDPDDRNPDPLILILIQMI